MRRTFTAALGALAFVFLCGFNVTQPAPAGSIQGYPFCSTAPSGNQLLQMSGSNWCGSDKVVLKTAWFHGAGAGDGNLEVSTTTTAHDALQLQVYGDSNWRLAYRTGTGLRIGDGTGGPTTVINESQQWVGAPIGPTYGGTGVTVGVSTVTSTGTFTTDASVAVYRAVLIGGGGGGGSSTGAGYGGNGGTSVLTSCLLTGAGAAYSVTIGYGGPAGTAGLTGTAGGVTNVIAGTGIAACNANGGIGGTNGTASNGTGGVSQGAATLQSILDATAPANVVGSVVSSTIGQTGNTGGGAVTSTFGIAAGLGCAGASCATDTAGASGKIIFIPEL